MATYVKNNSNSIAGTADADLILVGDVDELRFTSTTGQTLVVAASTAGIERIVVGTGSGVAAAVQVATLTNTPASLSASDFVLVAGS